MHFSLKFVVHVFIVSVEFPKLLVNKMPLFWSTRFHLLTSLLSNIQNYSKPLGTIENKKADFSALSRPFKNVENYLKSACVERVARIELALSGRKHDILPLNYTRKYETILIITYFRKAFNRKSIK